MSLGCVHREAARAHRKRRRFQHAYACRDVSDGGLGSDSAATVSARNVERGVLIDGYPS